MNRALKDANLNKSKALPAAGASASTASIDTGPVTDAARIENAELVINIPATSALAEAKDLTVTVEDSADNSSFAAVGALGVQTITGAVGDGNPATEYRFPLPAGLRRYVRAKAALEAVGGDITASSFTMALVF